jgi:hypothetical protein
MNRFYQMISMAALVAALCSCGELFPMVEVPLAEDADVTQNQGDDAASQSDSESDTGPCLPTVWYRDADNDKYGNKKLTVVGCKKPDGYVGNSDDCNDKDPKVHPKAPEICNSKDDNCDGEIDDNKKTWFIDKDHDGFGSKVEYPGKCDGKNTGIVDNSSDCDDGDSTVLPGMTEKCNGKDDNCDGETDEADASDVKTFFVDDDGDDHGSKTEVKSCFKQSNMALKSDDCDDENKNAYPGATEKCNEIDDNCDGETDEALRLSFYPDADGDGFGDSSAKAKLSCTLPKGHTADKSDCDDSDKEINTKATEVCDGVDNDCNGETDEGVKIDVYKDADGDGHGDKSKKSTACKAQAGYAVLSDDCNDSEATVYAGAKETCNDVDDDCDGSTDESDASGTSTFFYDGDQDGFGDKSKSVTACAAPPGFVKDATDCDDTRDQVNPKSDEICDGLDNDCDGKTDGPDSKNQKVFYKDADGDGYGATDKPKPGCVAPLGYSAKSGDCNDAEKGLNPGSIELCDGKDNDCDGSTDEGVTTKFYKDSDSDGYGLTGDVVEACAAPKGYTAKAGDCNDGNAKANPAASEICDGVDNDCDSKIDEDVKIALYADLDGDGFGDAKKPISDCKESKGQVADKTDCDDSKSTTFPGADEYCNDVDDDCDGKTDESDAKDAKKYYFDGDADKYGDAQTFIVSCKPIVGYTLDNTDCSDKDSKNHPKADEVCDGVDNDCDGLIDESDATDQKPRYLDEDGDGYGIADKFKLSCTPLQGYADKAGDCSDKDKDVNPGSAEVCDGVDNNCDGKTDEGVTKTFYVDSDGDSFGDATKDMEGCAPLKGFVADKTDCNDSNAKANPAGVEVCDGVDNDCNGKTDEPSSDKSICDDGNVLTNDSCEADKGCKNVSITFTFTCTLPDENSAKDGDTCSVGIFYGKAGSYGALSVNKDKLTIPATDLCKQMKAGNTLFVNSMVSTAMGSGAWVGGLYVGLVSDETKQQIKGTPGDVTILIPGLDFNFTLADFNICK